MNQFPLAATAPVGYGPIVFLILLIMAAGAAIILITHALPKAKRSGSEKDGTYESGMEVIGDARRRFNVRFYLVAVLFLIFDVELIFLYPWSILFTDVARNGTTEPGELAFLFHVMAIFFGILTFGFIYEWRKGVLRYD